MPSPQVETFVRMIRDKLPAHGTIERCVEVIKGDMSVVMGGSLPAETVVSLDAAAEIVRLLIENVEVLRPSSIIKPREKWYFGPRASDRHWPALEQYLLSEKEFGKEAVDSIDDASSEVVSLLENPARTQFRCRGLVVGYVQSGKTANMTAVIAKAVDAGYNLIVLLGGMTNKLRAQTQRRLESDIVARHRHLWQLYTTVDDEGDFIVPRNGSFTMPVEGRAQLAVMKKITSRLNAFIRTIDKTPPSILRELKVLLIDDECDQASVNSAKDDFDMTRINEAIRTIIKKLPAVSYVGYTATPFANVFIDPFPHNREELDDLYPEDFITVLPQPEEYFGAHEVFGTEPSDASDETEEEAGQSMIRTIDPDELKLLRPQRAADKDVFSPEVNESLSEAILWFIASSAIRLARGHSGKHMTMLVHSSPNIIQHVRMADAIKVWLAENEASLRSGAGPGFEMLEKVSRRELAAVGPQRSSHEIRPQALDLLPQINQVMDAIDIAIENGESGTRLDYTGDPKIYIVIGGAVLARGLTLEGLCVSFFLRTAKQYDTLLQMGRWFGYRTGYEDLPRLWTTADLASSFRALARIEEEVRQDIGVYREYELTPKQFAVRVRAIPGMAITSATKMKNAYRTDISYEGRHVQTIRFDHLSPGTIAGNWNAASGLVDSIGARSFDRVASGQMLARDVDVSLVRKFLRNYSISTTHMDLRSQHLIGFIDKMEGELRTWNVGVIFPGEGKLSGGPLGGLGAVRLVNRAKLGDSESHYADIKALMSKQDVLIDAGTRPGTIKGKDWADLKRLRPVQPLLLMYPIDAQSMPAPQAKHRVPLEADGDLIGIGIVFPGERNRSGNYFSVEIEAPTPEQLDREEEVEELDGAGDRNG